MVFDPNEFVTEFTPEPPIITLYSNHGVGKSNMIATASNPFVIDGEKKFSTDNKCTAYTPKDIDDLINCLDYLLNLNDKFNFGMVAIDTLDAIRQLLEDGICKEYKTKSLVDDRIKDLNYNKGHTVLANRFHSDVFAKLNEIRLKYRVPIIITAHSTKVKVSPPDSAEYDTLDLRIEKNLSMVVSDLSHIKMYMRLEKDYDQKGTMHPSEQRELIVAESPGITAKNNMFMSRKPIKISLLNAWQDFENYANECYKNRPRRQENITN